MVANSFDDDNSDDTHSALLDKHLDVMSTSDETLDNNSSHWWLKELENLKLITAILELSETIAIINR